MDGCGCRGRDVDVEGGREGGRDVDVEGEGEGWMDGCR